MVREPKGALYKELEMFLGTGAEDLGTQDPNSEEELGKQCCFRVWGLFFVLPMCIWHRDEKAT